MVEPDISVILPTLRPGRARKCIDSIAEASAGVNYEAVVVSPLDMPEILTGCKGYGRIKFVREDKKEGSCRANALGYENAGGKYVFAIADDHLLGRDCLKNLIRFMQPHDNEIFLAGARCCGVYGAAPECRAYGFYYAFNPCIRRSVAGLVGGFYDPYYKCYYGDPDLAMRVWHAGGRAELCPDAWVEFHNEFDGLDLESQEVYAERDFRAFFSRWHPYYGRLAKSCNEEDINVGNKYAFPGIPPEKCTRLIVFLRKRNWEALKRELESESTSGLNADNLFYVLEDMLKHLAWIHIPSGIQLGLSKWLLRRLLDLSLLQEREKAAVYESGMFSGADYRTGPSELMLARIAMFLLDEAHKRENEPVVENYKGTNIFFSRQKFYSWPCAYGGGFHIKAFRKASGACVFCEPRIDRLIARIDRLAGGAPFAGIDGLSHIEDFFAPGNGELRADQQFVQNVFEKLPGEICIRLVYCLKFRYWAETPRLLNEPGKGVFAVRRHLAVVYEEIRREMGLVPPGILLMLLQWLWKQLEFSSLYAGNITAEQDRSDIRLVLQGYRQYNIVYCRGVYYGWPCLAGEFLPSRYSEGCVPGAVAGPSPLGVKKLIDSRLGPAACEEADAHGWIEAQQNEALLTCDEVEDLDSDIRLVVHGYREYNIVYCKGLYYGWPQSAGRFSLMREMNGFEPEAVAGTSVLDVKKLIDLKTGPAGCEEENRFDWTIC